MTAGALLDIDGTLVDSNYQHALSWYRAFLAHDVVLPIWRIHRHIGMGGDQLVEALAGEQIEQRAGDDLRAAEGELFAALIEEVRPLPGARALIVELRDRGWPVVIASSSKESDLDHYLDLLDARELIDATTTSADVDETKPKPDLVRVALDKLGADTGVLIGDSTWDCLAAERAGIDTVALLTGGFSAAELTDAGALAIFDSIPDLLERIDETALRAPAADR